MNKGDKTPLLDEVYIQVWGHPRQTKEMGELGSTAAGGRALKCEAGGWDGSAGVEATRNRVAETSLTEKGRFQEASRK